MNMNPTPNIPGSIIENRVYMKRTSQEMYQLFQKLIVVAAYLIWKIIEQAGYVWRLRGIINKILSGQKKIWTLP